MKNDEFDHDGVPKQEEQSQDTNKQETNKQEFPINETDRSAEPKEEAPVVGPMPPKEAKTKRKSRFATKVPDILADGARVLVNWKNSPYVLHSLPKETFEETLAKLKEEYEKQTSVTPNINNSVIRMRDIRKRTELGVSKIKHTLRGKYSENDAVRYFSEFSIIHENKAYVFPSDRDGMLLGLEKMLSAIVAHGLTDHEFGLPYWQEIQTDLLEVTPNADTQDVSKSKHTGNLQKYKALAQRQLRCIAKLVEAENPDEPDRALMNMGFFRRN